MPADNRISAELAAAAKTQILTKIDEIHALLPFLVNLTEQESRSLPTIGAERTGMVEAFSLQINAHPEFVPSYVDVAEMARDRALRVDLLEVYAAVGGLHKGLRDTLQVVGSDLYTNFLSFYSSVQRAVSGAGAVLEDLRRFMPRGRPATPAAAKTSA